MADRIKVTSKRLPRIISTSPKLPRIDGADLARALGAERIGGPPEIEPPADARIVEKLAIVDEAY